METYRIINRELSLNNQELRNALNKLKHEVTYLNSQLFEQREQFNRLRDSLATTIEKKCNEIMTLIYPERIDEMKSASQIDLVSHRRSCNNITAAESLKNRIFSPPAGSPEKDLLVDVNLKTPIPKIVVERDARIRKSPNESPEIIVNRSHTLNSSDMQISAEYNEDKQVGLDISEDLLSPSNTLGTINEELNSRVDSLNETLTDATINNLLDAPCSTPYNPYKLTNGTTLETKEMRVMVQKLSVDKISQLMMNSIRRNSSHLNAVEYTSVKTRTSKESSTKILVEPVKIVHKKKSKESISKANKSRGTNGTFKENNFSGSENTCSEDESNVLGLTLRRRKKNVSLKEPSLRQKLRNTTNLKP